MGGPAAAITLGRTIIVHPSARITRSLVQHELAHVRQWEQNRWTFPLRYLANHLRYGYHDNPYEVAARAAEQ
ncbi:MAG: eCIS core domain-containing protein [Gemmatimonadota bacterium]